MSVLLKESGTKILWCVPAERTESDSKGAAVSDVILISGGDPADTSLAGSDTSKLFVRTLGKDGVLYRFRDGSWNLLRPSSGDDINFDAAADLIAAGLIYCLSRTDAVSDTLEERLVEKILGEAIQYVIEFHRNTWR